jgi:hypothetical protein
MNHAYYISGHLIMQETLNKLMSANSSACPFGSIMILRKLRLLNLIFKSTKMNPGEEIVNSPQLDLRHSPGFQVSCVK